VSSIWFPLWMRMAVAFGTLTGVFVLLWGVWDLRGALADEESRRKQRLVGLAQTVAVSLDGVAIAKIKRTADMNTAPYIRVTEQLRKVRDANDLAWIGTSVRDERGHYHSVIDGGNPPPIPVGYPIFDGIALRETVYTGQVNFERQMIDEWGAWTVAMAPIYREEGEVVGIVEVMEDAAWQSLYVQGRIQRTLAQTFAVVLLSCGFSAAFARQMGRPLQELTGAVLAVAGGDLKRDMAVVSRDEIGALSHAFNQMVIGLRERERIRKTFGQFVSDEVAAYALADGGVSLGGEARTVTILFSDLRGFAAMSMQQPPKETLSILNRYFSVMTDVILAHEGNVSELLGDGMLVLFGAPIQHEDDAQRAVLCAVEMQHALERFNAHSGLQLEMGIGVATGVVVAGNIGSEKRMKYGVVGPPINLAARLESFTVGSQILIDDVTRQAAAPVVEVGARTEMLAKGWAMPVVCYPVRSVGMLVAPEETMILSWAMVRLPASCRPIRHKRLDEHARVAEVLGVTRRNLILRTRWSVELRDKLQLSFGDGPSKVEEVYGLVTEVSVEDGEWLSQLRITSIPEESQRRLFQLVSRQ
jgi:class 3 adenylate cyclase